MQIKTADLKAVLLAAGKKDLRYYLNGVHVNSRHIVGTDGSRMHVIAHGGDWPHDPVTIPREVVELAVKAKTLELTLTTEALGAISYKPVGGTYPDYTRVLPASSDVVTGERHVDVNPEYWRAAEKAIKLIGWKGEHPALSHVGNCWYWCNGRLAVVVMPQRLVNPKTGERGYQLERLQ